MPVTTTLLSMALKDAQRYLVDVSDTPRLDAEILLAHALQKPRSYLYTWPESRLTMAQARRFETFVVRRMKGEPIAYITGYREFWSLKLDVTPATLIPRPETEQLVELALGQIPVHAPVLVADLGTGSGAIALAIGHERPQAQIVATDNNPAALAIAAGNARRLEISVDLRQGDWCQALDAGQFAVIVCNPPYLAKTDPHLYQDDLRYEPPSALIAGADGLSAIRTVVQQALSYLQPGGWLFLEHGYRQGADVNVLLHRAGYTSVTMHRDAADLGRVASAKKPVN